MRLSQNTNQILTFQQTVSQELDNLLIELKYLTSEHFGVNTDKYLKLVLELMVEANDPDNFSEEYEQGSFYLKDNIKKLKDSLNLALDVHKNEIRDSNLPYVFHPFGVGLNLARLGFPDYLVHSGILHDVLESDNCNLYHINRMKQIGLNVYYNVEYVSTKKIKDPNIKDNELYGRIENLSMVNVSPEILKSIDGLVNVFDLDGMQENEHSPREKRIERFIKGLRNKALNFADKIDNLYLIRISDGEIRFLLKQYFNEKLISYGK